MNSIQKKYAQFSETSKIIMTSTDYSYDIKCEVRVISAINPTPPIDLFFFIYTTSGFS